MTRTMSQYLLSVNPVFVIAAIIGVVLGIFLATFYIRVGWEKNLFGIRRRWQRHQRRKRRQVPEYGPLQHDTPADQPKPSA